MKPAPFEYHRPGSLSEATALLSSLENAKVLAGGQSLVPMMNFRYLIVDHIVDLGAVEGLSGISSDSKTLRIGAMTRQREIEFSDEVARHCPLMYEALRHIGHRQTRNRGTIGGSLSHADPAAELSTVCAALDANVEVASAKGSRKVPFREFAVGFMATALAPDEILTAIEVPIWPAGHGYGFREFARRRGDFAIVGAAALVECDPKGVVRRASIALCGVAPAPIRLTDAEAALTGKPLEKESVKSAAGAARTIDPMTDIHASADYRRHLAEVQVFRALCDAGRRAGKTM